MKANGADNNSIYLCSKVDIVLLTFFLIGEFSYENSSMIALYLPGFGY